jgi:hypothetical protein
MKMIEDQWEKMVPNRGEWELLDNRSYSTRTISFSFVVFSVNLLIKEFLLLILSIICIIWNL